MRAGSTALCAARRKREERKETAEREGQGSVRKRGEGTDDGREAGEGKGGRESDTGMKGGHESGGGER